MTATLPRFLLNGDRGTMHLDVDNVEGQAGEYRVEVRSDGVNVVGNAAPQTMRLNAKQRSAVSVPLTAPAVGIGNVTVRVSGPAGFALERSYALAVRPATQILARRTVQTVARGEASRCRTTCSPISCREPAACRSRSGCRPRSTRRRCWPRSTAIRSAAPSRSPAARCRCSMSTISPARAQLALDGAVDQRIREFIDRLLARQGSNGSFGLWSVGGDDVWLDCLRHRLPHPRARAQLRGARIWRSGWRCSGCATSSAMPRSPRRNGGRKLAYALYVLARNGAAPVGDLRYFVDTKLDDFATTIAKAQLAAALGMLGDKVRAERVFAAALRSMAPQPTLEYGRVDYGSILRDGAALITLASEGGAPRATITDAIERVEAARGLTPYTSTQENAWMVLAARALAKDADRRVARRRRREASGRAQPALPRARARAAAADRQRRARRRCRRW